MLIEDLIRLGKPLLGGQMTTAEVLRLITDVGDERVKNFYRNVFVVVLPETGEPIALARKKLNESVENQPWKPTDQVLGVPFVLPSGGNPVNPQGCYGVPVYPLYDPHIEAFRKSVDLGIPEGCEDAFVVGNDCAIFRDLSNSTVVRLLCLEVVEALTTAACKD